MKKPFLAVPALILLIVFTVIACKKDNKQEEAATNVTVSLLNTGLQDAFIRYSPDTTTYNVIAKMQGEAFAVPNKTVTLQVEPSILTAYNTASGTHFELLPDSVYTLAKASTTILTGEGQAQLPVQFLTNKINPYIKYALPLKITGADINIDASANTTILRVLLANNYTGIYTDTISSAAVPPTYPTTPPAMNFTDSIVTKTLTALNDSTIVMEMLLPAFVPANQYLVMHLDTATNNISLSVYGATPAEMLQFTAANVGLLPYYRKSDKYFYLPYNYFNTDYRIKERLKKQ